MCFRAWVGPENREVKACRWDSENAPMKAYSTQVKQRITQVMRVQSRSLVRVSGDQEALSRCWDRGSMLTEDAVGRHRRGAIESSVVRITSMCRTVRLNGRVGNR